MGFDIGYMCVKNGEPGEIPVAVVKNAFAPYLSACEDGHGNFYYYGRAGGELYIDVDRPNADGFTVSRPPLHPEFWRAIFELLQYTPSFLSWPGDIFAIADPTFRDHMPPSLLEPPFEVIVVKSGLEISKAIQES
jgi:hypothetical protein